MSDVIEFYDNFSSRQARAGINNRHISILFHLEQLGLKKDHHVLEVGCGIGTVSELILQSLSPHGTLHAVDISPKSIDIAKRLISKYKNATVEVRDLTKEKINTTFDVIVLPDVLEHIPFDLYTPLFENLNQMLSDDGFIFIHIPHPNYLEWLIKQGSKELQIIDNPVYTNKLSSLIYPAGFYIDYLKSYSVYSKSPDYQIILLRKKSATLDYTSRTTFFQMPLSRKVIKKFSYLLRGFK
ncbi:MAG TPA: class I SAM-dependent methyltransferase [Ohtaekwangia sp.]|nr:class I SAM-dependent methyltransferase [Ohtaekwangia sp.]